MTDSGKCVSGYHIKDKHGHLLRRDQGWFYSCFQSQLSTGEGWQCLYDECCTAHLFWDERIGWYLVDLLVRGNEVILPCETCGGLHLIKIMKNGNDKVLGLELAKIEPCKTIGTGEQKENGS